MTGSCIGHFVLLFTVINLYQRKEDISLKRNLGLIIPLFLCFSLLTGFRPALHDPADLNSDPVSTTGSLYGFQGELQEDVLSDAPFELVTGKYEVSGIQRVVKIGRAHV